MTPWPWVKAATAACSCLSVMQIVSMTHLAKAKGEVSFAAPPKAADAVGNGRNLLSTTKLRSAGHGLPRSFSVAPPTAVPRPVVLSSPTLAAPTIELESRVRIPLPPSHALEGPAIETKPASVSQLPVLTQLSNPSGAAGATTGEAQGARESAVQAVPAPCLSCPKLSETFDLFYLGRASGGSNQEPVTMHNAVVRAESDPAHTASDAQPPIDARVVDNARRSVDEPDLQVLPAGEQVQSLQQALARTYQTNPTLMARRAELRGLDNVVALERSAGNLQVSATSTFGQEVYITRPLGGRARNLRSNVDFSKVLYAGGRIQNATRSAQTRVMAGRADLRATEGDILTEAVAAYADVQRDREIRDLNASQVKILVANLESTNDRFRVRDLTMTDVAQSETRLEVAKSNLVTAEGRLRASEENFERIVGARAGDLQPLPPLPPLPLSSDLAAETALANNASIAAFAARARSADFDVAVSRASRSPTLSVFSSVDNVNALGTANSASGLPPGTTPNSETNIVAGLQVRIPLYQGGGPSARVRQDEEIRSQYIEEAIAVERLVLADARSAFAIWRSTTTAISFNEQAVASSEKALGSVRFEQNVGARSILDVLNAEQEFLNSKIALTSARRDAYVAAFELLNSMGASEAADLNFAAGPLYDPAVNYRDYSNTWSDWRDGPRRSPVSTRNAPPEADSPLTRLNNGKFDEFKPDD